MLFERGVGGGVVHPEGIEDSGLDELVVGLAADEFDDASEDGVSAIGVCGSGAGFEAEGGNGVGAGADVEWPRIPAGQIESGFGSESGHVAEEVMDANGCFDGFENGLFGSFGCDGLQIFIFGEEVGEQGIELEFTVFDEHEDGGGGDGFGLRGDPEEGVWLHRRLFGWVGESDCGGIEQGGSGGGEGDGSIEFTGLDEALKSGMEGFAVVVACAVGDGGQGEEEKERREERGYETCRWGLGTHGDGIERE